MEAMMKRKLPNARQRAKLRKQVLEQQKRFNSPTMIHYSREALVTRREQDTIEDFIKYLIRGSRLFGNELDIHVPSLVQQGYYTVGLTLILNEEQLTMDFDDKQVIRQLLLTCPRKR